MPKTKTKTKTSSSTSKTGVASAASGGDGSSFRDRLLKKASDARTSRPKKTPEDYAAARDAAFKAIVFGDSNADNCRGGYDINAKPLLELMETGAEDGYTSAIIYRWNWCSRPSNRAWTFNNVRLRDLLFNNPSRESGFKDNDNLIDKLQKYITKEYGEGFNVVFRKFGGKRVQPRSGEGSAGGAAGAGGDSRPRFINQKFQLSVMWGEPRDEREGSGRDGGRDGGRGRSDTTEKRAPSAVEEKPDEKTDEENEAESSDESEDDNSK